MRFLMLVCRDASIELSPEERATIGQEVAAWVSEMEQCGVRLHGDVLAPADATATVRVRDAEVTVGHGPRTQTADPASGFNIVSCATMDEAVEVAAKHPIARFGTIELRPIAEM